MISDPVIVIAILVGLIAAYSLGEWVGQHRERIRWMRKANVLDFTPGSSYHGPLQAHLNQVRIRRQR